MKNLTALLIICALGHTSHSQNINENFERWSVVEKNINITGIDIAPDGNKLAMVCGSKQPLIIYDLKERKVIKEIDVKAEYLGYNVYFSNQANFLLLQEKKIETSFKKAKKADYTVVDLKSGSVIQRHIKINDAKISFDEKQLITLENGTVNYRDIYTGKILKQFTPEEACNALAISPDGKDLAVVIKPNKKEVMEVPSIRSDKKAIKANAKLKHMIAIYDVESFEQKELVKEVYDNINLLFYSDDGKRLLSFNVGANSYVNVVKVEGYEALREGYLGKTSTQPEFGYNSDYQRFGIATVDQWPAINIYDVSTGRIVDSYNTQMKVWKNLKKKIYTGTNTSFVFLPDGKHVLIGYGNSLIKWKIDKN